MIAHCDKHNNDYLLGSSCYYCNHPEVTKTPHPDEEAARELEEAVNCAEIHQRKRDRFELAKAAMQGLLANPEVVHIGGTRAGFVDRVQIMACNYTDGLLLELDKKVAE